MLASDYDFRILSKFDLIFSASLEVITGSNRDSQSLFVTTPLGQRCDLGISDPVDLFALAYQLGVEVRFGVGFQYDAIRSQNVVRSGDN